MPNEDETFDVVTSNYVYQNTPYEWSRISEKNGCCIFCDNHLILIDSEEGYNFAIYMYLKMRLYLLQLI